ncbi:hypothetical protein [Calothrix sp. CCY 0018]|uniref:hypothetical protein n=1 Tax=Calothrix sp. CCY 0018 TaxID=3103864 RepID=UPI0039C72D20
MPTTHKIKRISVGLPALYVKKLEKYSALLGQALSPAATYLIQTKLDELEEAGKLDESSDVFADYIDVLSGAKSVKNLDIQTLSRLTGKPIEILEATIHEHINKGRESCCTDDCEEEKQDKCQNKQ